MEAAYVELTGEGGESRLSINAGEDMEGELLWPLNDDLFTLGVPSNHMVVFGFFEKTEKDQAEVSFERRRREEAATMGSTDVYSFVRNVADWARLESCLSRADDCMSSISELSLLLLFPTGSWML